MIRILIPDMPTADELLPYLREIDETKHYVKNGPLVRRLELELSALTRATCTVVSNGTVSLEMALRALNLQLGAKVLVPAVTFVATGQAIVNAGLQPVITDVDPDTWLLSSEHARTIIENDLTIQAVMPVAAFGRPVPIEPWAHFARTTGLPVLIDAAGAIYGQASSLCDSIAISYSLNATKALGAGEGGVVASCNLRLIERVASMANFGRGGTNARMSEYHAAVALASLKRNASADDWRSRLATRYAQSLPAGVKVGGGEQPARTLLPVLLPSHCATGDVITRMRGAWIETRAWYRPFLDERPEFLAFEKVGPMPATDMLRQRLLGLPYHAFLNEDDVITVCTQLEKAIA